MGIKGTEHRQTDRYRDLHIISHKLIHNTTTEVKVNLALFALPDISDGESLAVSWQGDELGIILTCLFIREFAVVTPVRSISNSTP